MGVKRDVVRVGPRHVDLLHQGRGLAVRVAAGRRRTDLPGSLSPCWTVGFQFPGDKPGCQLSGAVLKRISNMTKQPEETRGDTFSG